MDHITFIVGVLIVLGLCYFTGKFAVVVLASGFSSDENDKAIEANMFPGDDEEEEEEGEDLLY